MEEDNAKDIAKKKNPKQIELIDLKTGQKWLNRKTDW